MTSSSCPEAEARPLVARDGDQQVVDPWGPSSERARQVRIGATVKLCAARGVGRPKTGSGIREVEQGEAVRRRRECLSCTRRFTTVERMSQAVLWVLKRSGHREPFDRAKVIAGARAACKNRPVGADQLDDLAASVERTAWSLGPDVQSEQVGLAVLECLRQLDDVAAVRFASVYKGFEEVDDFAELGLLNGRRYETIPARQTRARAQGLEAQCHDRVASQRATGEPLAIYAHPDDPAISCGGTLASWAPPEAWSMSSSARRVTRARRTRTWTRRASPGSRVVEAERSAAVLGVVSTHFLGRLDGELENDSELRRELVAIIREVRPEAIISPDPLAVFFGEHHYNHRDHRIVGWAALDAAAPAAALPLYFKGTGRAHQVAAAYLSGSLEPSVWVDVTSTIDRKIEAVGCHISQLVDAGDWIASALRDGAEDAGREVGVGYAEPFRRIRLAP